MYLIEKAWGDPLENNSNAAFGYAPYKCVSSLDVAQRMVAESPTITKEKFGWAADITSKELRIVPIDFIGEPESDYYELTIDKQHMFVSKETANVLQSICDIEKSIDLEEILICNKIRMHLRKLDIRSDNDIHLELNKQ